MLDTMLMWRAEQLRAPEHQSIKHMQAWKLKTNVSVDMLEQEASALEAFAIFHRSHRPRVALSYIDFRFPELEWRNGHPRLSAWHGTFVTRPAARANEAVDD